MQTVTGLDGFPRISRGDRLRSFGSARPDGTVTSTGTRCPDAAIPAWRSACVITRAAFLAIPLPPLARRPLLPPVTTLPARPNPPPAAGRAVTGARRTEPPPSPRRRDAAGSASCGPQTSHATRAESQQALPPVPVPATPFAIAPLRTARGLAPRRHRTMHPRRAKCAHRRSPPPGPRRAQPRALCAARRPQSLPRLPPHRRRRGLRRPWCWPEGGREVRGPGRSRASSASARQPSRVRTRVRACAAARRRGRVRGLSNRIPVRRFDRRAPRERMA